MTFSISTIAASLSLLLVVSANAAVNIKQTRHVQSNLRHVKGAMRNPEANDRNEQEALTREDIMEQNGQQQEVQQVQTSQLQQKQIVAQKQEQQLLQAQAAQMKQMQEQLMKQQQELQRLQQLEQKPAAKPSTRPKTKRRPAHQLPKKALVGVKAKMMTKSGAGAAGNGIAKPKGWDQCLKFARFVKTKDVTGVELVRTWKSTCEPAVQSGRATERYKLMCNSLSGVVEPYAAQIDYDVEQLCDSVLAVFHDVTAVDVKG